MSSNHVESCSANEVSLFTVLETLSSWSSQSPLNDIGGSSEQSKNVCKDCKINVDGNLNKKLYISNTNIALLEVDGIALPINEMCEMKTSLSFRVYKVAGSDFVLDFNKIDDLKTGDVIVTPPSDLHARFALHAMEPKVNHRYRSAAESSLHQCYRNLLEKARSLHLRTVAISPLYSTSDQLLYNHMTHIALRTVRCYLDRFADAFDAIVFVTDEDTNTFYECLAPVYFPRTSHEALTGEKARKGLEFDEWGGSLYDERSIRISNEATVRLTNTDTDDDDSCTSMIDHDEVREFARMAGDHDRKRRWQLRTMQKQQRNSSQQRLYPRLLREAKLQDLSEVEILKQIVYVSGVDEQGSPVVVVVANYLQQINPDHDKTVKYLIRLLDTHVNNPYNIVYLCTNAAQQVNRELLMKIYGIVDQRYVDNLKKLIVVHPTFFNKIYALYFSTFFAPDMRRKLVFAKSLTRLYRHVEKDEVRLPAFVAKHDSKVNRTQQQQETRQDAQLS